MVLRGWAGGEAPSAVTAKQRCQQRQKASTSAGPALPYLSNAGEMWYGAVVIKQAAGKMGMWGDYYICGPYEVLLMPSHSNLLATAISKIC